MRQIILLQLYLQFFKIGALAFGGGYAVLPLIQEFVVLEKGWLTMTEFTDLVSISQMTPGPIAINSATFVGSTIAGVPGSIAATLGATTPQFILMMILGYFLFSKNKKFKILDFILNGIRPGVIGLILIAAISMAYNSLFPEGTIALSAINPVAGICFVIGLILYAKNMDLLKLIGLGAVMGVILTTLL